MKDLHTGNYTGYSEQKNELSINERNMLSEAINSGIIKLDSVQNELIASKISEIKKSHPYAVTPPNTPTGRWSTYFKDPTTGKRINIKGKTEDELYRKLLNVYCAQQNLDNITFHNLFEEWIDYKTYMSNSPNTVLRHKQRFQKYLETSSLDSMRIRQISVTSLEKECNKIIEKFCLSSKEWTNVKTILNGMFSYAIRNGYLDKNPLDTMIISKKFRQICKKTGKTETYNTDELKALFKYLEEQYEQTKDVTFLAVKLNFYLGLRVGELVALKWEDRIDFSHLHIKREEVRNQDTNEVMVAEHTKTNTDRIIPLVPKAINILLRIPDNGSEYMFTHAGGRIKARKINYVLKWYAIRNGLPVKSSHKIRKTVASLLNANGVPIDTIREILGHSNLSTTYNYIYNPLTEKETYEMISKAL
ncbi:MAG: site-specific integrase [Lachnospiraceae bacterium]|nr:site-specific integrase [Lachnospiraceae bacterium]